MEVYCLRDIVLGWEASISNPNVKKNHLKALKDRCLRLNPKYSYLQGLWRGQESAFSQTLQDGHPKYSDLQGLWRGQESAFSQTFQGWSKHNTEITYKDLYYASIESNPIWGERSI